MYTIIIIVLIRFVFGSYGRPLIFFLFLKSRQSHLAPSRLVPPRSLPRLPGYPALSPSPFPSSQLVLHSPFPSFFPLPIFFRFPVSAINLSPFRRCSSPAHSFSGQAVLQDVGGRGVRDPRELGDPQVQHPVLRGRLCQGHGLDHGCRGDFHSE